MKIVRPKEIVKEEQKEANRKYKHEQYLAKLEKRKAEFAQRRKDISNGDN